ncbi:arsenate reductase family protein [Oceanobacillus neutriphilus]|uniref:Arsenate reductase n=1 Tax=Oceanobacillus neutriphilus TaxID=531815 RepID=A0ABQ2NZ20_9BACI|nr:arsenate reductase family protein [Oceanobacillus neutriphilus]GGP14119.1 arsenate reductase [Oceanobacillus neutriphilus]
MTLSFYWYPKCGTCRNAKKWLDENQIDYKAIHIVEETPSESQILSLMETSDLPAKKFFNTSGKKYRELHLKEKINDLSPQEMAEILASDGMLIKRPILTDGKKVTAGFKEEVYESAWK